MNTNTGRKSLVKNQYVRIGGIVQQYNTLPINFLPPTNSFAKLFSPHYFSYVLNFSTPLLNLSSFLFPHYSLSTLFPFFLFCCLVNSLFFLGFSTVIEISSLNLSSIYCHYFYSFSH